MEVLPTKPCHQRNLRKGEPRCENEDGKCSWVNSKCRPKPNTPVVSLDTKVDQILDKISNIEKEITMLRKTQKNTLNAISPIEQAEHFNMSTPSSAMNTNASLNKTRRKKRKLLPKKGTFAKKGQFGYKSTINRMEINSAKNNGDNNFNNNMNNKRNTNNNRNNNTRKQGKLLKPGFQDINKIELQSPKTNRSASPNSNVSYNLNTPPKMNKPTNNTTRKQGTLLKPGYQDINKIELLSPKTNRSVNQLSNDNTPSNMKNNTLNSNETVSKNGLNQLKKRLNETSQ